MLNEITRDHSRGEARHEHAACTLCGGRAPMLCGPPQSRAEAKAYRSNRRLEITRRNNLYALRHMVMTRYRILTDLPTLPTFTDCDRL